MPRERRLLATSALLAAMWLGGCAQRPSPRVVLTRPAAGSVYARPQAGLTPEQARWRDAHCFMGCPELSRSAGYGPTVILYRGGYVLEHSSVDKIPIWVAEQVTAAQIGGDEERSDSFRADPELKPGVRAELKDYRGSGYDRGHQAPAANQSRDAKLKAETFYLSNMCPQAPAFNQQAWRELESLTRKWVQRYGQAYEITGPMFYDPREDDPALADGTVQFEAIGPNHVAVPTHFYKIVIAREDGGPWQAIAFVLENRPYRRPFRFEQHIRPVEWIERRTGINFMPDLNAREQRRIERAVPAMWN